MRAKITSSDRQPKAVVRPMSGLSKDFGCCQRELQQRVAQEVDALPEGSIIVDWLADYTVMRAQMSACD